MYIKNFIAVLIILASVVHLQANNEFIQWRMQTDSLFPNRITFDNALHDPNTNLPYWQRKVENKIIAHAYISNASFEILSEDEISLLQGLRLPEEIEVKNTVNKIDDFPVSYLEIFPFRFNRSSKKAEKLVGFDLEIIEGKDHNILYSNKTTARSWKTQSVLATGDWFKLGILESGVYLLNFNYLTNLDASFNGAQISSIKLFGNGGDMLPQKNDDPRVDDLAENPLQVFDQNGNGIFEAGDYLLFYGDATDKWQLDDGRFKRTINFYADTSYYFLTKQGTGAKRIQSRSTLSQNPDISFSNFDDRQQHQMDLTNLIKSGREWYGELFDFTLQRDFSFSFPNLITSEEMCIEMEAAARHTPSSTRSIFRLSVNSNQIGPNIEIIGVNTGYGQQYNSRILNQCVIPQNTGIGDNFTLKLSYDKNGSNNAKGYLNYITVQAKRNLVWNNSQLHFRHKSSDQGGIYEFVLNNTSNDVIIWDVSDCLNPIAQSVTVSGNQRRFRYTGSTGTINEFIAFTPSLAVNPLSARRIANQNLHSHSAKDLIIITHPSLLSEAQRFADYKLSVKGLSVGVVLVNDIYNEFSSGKQDLSALRDYLKMLYDRAPDDIENVLLFGDCSYDYKYRSPNNQNFVPVFESPNSLNDIISQSSDDYITFLEDGLGAWPYNFDGQRTHKMNIGVGRFPVKNIDEARVVVDKVIFYENKREVFGDWLNRLTFVADDADDNLHMSDAEYVSNIAAAANPGMNIQKIYVDAYPEVASPSGALSIEGKNALNRAIQDGTLILNYSGHGGEIGWTEEQILRLEQIPKWENYDKLTFFFTATCEFGRYDDPDVVSGGELVLLVGNGGAVSIMTTTRAVFASSNKNLNAAFYNHIFDRENGEQLTMGEVIRRTKNQSEDVNNRSFALLGDPSMKLNYPDKKVLIKEINNTDLLVSEDTMKALCLVNIKGQVSNLDSSLLSNFNGFVDLYVFDKELNLQTLGNSKSKFSYSQYKNLLFKGTASVKAGEFSVNFIVPKDINYSLGKGKITAYARDYDNNTDANGFENRFYVGSSCDNIPLDNEPPQITIYLDDTSFVSGSLTSSSPELIAYLEDENGINFTGTGIGHDITAHISAIQGEKIILNDYYLSELDSYQKGKVNYQLENIPDGRHQLTLKAWDTHNNSSEETVEFIVASDESIALQNVFNYPNPFKMETYFAFDHNRSGEDIEMELRIVDRMGRLVKSSLIDIPNSNTRVDGLSYDQLKWDGTNSQNEKIASGIYYFEIIVKSKEDGAIANEVKRLVYIK